MKKKALYIALSLGLLTSTVGSTLQAVSDRETEETTQETLVEAISQEKVREHIVQQLKRLDFFLEKTGLELNNYRIWLAHRKTGYAHIIKIREALQELIKTEATYSVRSLLYRNRKLVDHIAASIESQFSLTEEPSYAIDEESMEAIDLESMEIELSHRDIRLDRLESAIETMGLSALNVFSRSLSEYGKDTGLTELVTRALPYIGFYAYWKFFLQKPFAAAAQNQPNDKPVKVSDQLLAFGAGALTETLPMVNIGLGAAFVNNVTQDLADLAKWASRQYNEFFAYCKNDLLFDDGQGYLLALGSLNDVVGAHKAKAELTPILDYFKDKRTIDRISASIERSYLLSGPLDTSRLLAYYLAAEISTILRAQKKVNSDCRLHIVHASSLVQKSLKEVLKEAEKRAPCVILLEEIDCIHSFGLRKIKSSVWADILGSMNALSRSKKDVFVITSATNDHFAGPTDLARYGIFAKVENPTYEDRVQFLKIELGKRALALSGFDLDKLATKTEGYTFIHLENVLKRAYSQCHPSRETLTQEVLEKAIDAKEARTPRRETAKLLASA